MPIIQPANQIAVGIRVQGSRHQAPLEMVDLDAGIAQPSFHDRAGA